MSDDPLSPVDRVMLEKIYDLYGLVADINPGESPCANEARAEIDALLSAPDEPGEKCYNNGVCALNGCPICLEKLMARLWPQPVEQEPDTGGQIEQITAERDAFRACLRGFSDSLPSDEHMRAQGKEPGPLLVQMRKLLEGYAPDRSGSVMDFAVSILHGDDKHQAWLLEEAAKWMPVPAPTEQPTKPGDPGHFGPHDGGIALMTEPTPEQPSGEDGEGGEITRLALAGAISREKEANREWSKAAMERDETKRQLEALQAKYSELLGLVRECRKHYGPIPPRNEFLKALFNHPAVKEGE